MNEGAGRLFSSLSRVLRSPVGGPVVRSSDGPVWVVSGYREARAVLRQPELYTSRPMRRADPVLLGACAADHERSRPLVARAMHAALTEVVPDQRAVEVLSERLTALRDGDIVDLTSDCMEPAVNCFVGALLGLAPTVWPRLRGWAEATVTAAYGGPRTPALLDQERELSALVARETSNPHGSFVAHLAGLAGATLSLDDLVSVSRLMINAASDTTLSWLSLALKRLLEDPSLGHQLRSAPELLDRFLDEVLRLESPVQYVLRQSEATSELGSQRIEAGALIVVWLGAANRDSSVFQAPDSFLLARDSTERPLALGAGPHVCLGAAVGGRLSRRLLCCLMEYCAHVAFELAATPRYLTRQQLRSAENLRVRVRLDAASDGSRGVGSPDTR